MAFNLDHTQNGDITFKGAHVAFTGDFIFPIPTQARDYHVLMTDNAGFGLEALLNANQELSGKVNISDLGSAAYLDADNVVLPILEDNGYGVGVLSENIIPASISNTQHTVQYSGGLEYLVANKGDIATVVSSAQTYILTGNNKATDWFPLENEPLKVTSVQTKTGDLTVNGSEILSSTFGGCTVQALLNDIYQNKANDSAKDNLIYSNDLSCCFTAANLINSSDINCALMPNGYPAYLTSSELTSCTSVLTTSGSFDCTLLNYVLDCSISNKAGHCSFNFIENGGCLVKVNQDSKLDSCLFGDIAYNTHYTVSSEGDLNSLGAQAGDIAIGTSSEEGKTWILDNSGNWQVIMSGVAGLFFLNSLSPDALGCVTLNSQDLVLDGTNDQTPTSTKISNISVCYNYLTIDQPYAPFNCCLYPYITTGEVSNYLSAKSDTVHTHLICEVADLENCLASYQPSPFVTGAYCSASTDPSISMGGTMNLVLGQGGSDAGYDYAVIHAAGSGDAQVIEFKTKSNLNNYVGDVVFAQDGLDLVSVDLIAHDYYGQNISYRIEGLFSTFSGTTSIIGEAAVTTFAENIGGCTSNPILVPTNNCVQICIDTNFGNFNHALANVTLVHVH